MIDCSSGAPINDTNEKKTEKEADSQDKVVDKKTKKQANGKVNVRHRVIL